MNPPKQKMSAERLLRDAYTFLKPRAEANDALRRLRQSMRRLDRPKALRDLDKFADKRATELKRLIRKIERELGI